MHLSLPRPVHECLMTKFQAVLRHGCKCALLRPGAGRRSGECHARPAIHRVVPYQAHANPADVPPQYAQVAEFPAIGAISQKKQMIEQFRGMSREQFLSFYEHCELVEQASDIEDFIDLGNITASTLILNGEFDAILDSNDIEKASLRIPDCEFKMVPGAGHFLHWEQADILYTYSEFLARA